MKKTRCMLTAAALAVSLAAGAIPAAAAEMSEPETRAAAIKYEAGELEKEIRELEDDQTLLSGWIADFEAGLANEDRNALAVTTPYSSEPDETLVAYEAQLDEAREAYDAAAAQYSEAKDDLASAKGADANADSAREELAVLLTGMDEEPVTAGEKTAANMARMETIKEEIAALKSTPLTEAYDEEVVIEEAYDEQVLVSEAYDEEVKVQEAHTEEVEGDWTWTLPENAKYADAIYKYGCICNTCNEIFYDDENKTGQQKWSRHSDEMYVAWAKAGYPEGDGWQHGGYHVAPRIVGYTVYYDDIYETVHHGPVYKTVHHDAVYGTAHHDAVYDTETIEALQSEYARLEAENETIERDTELIKEAEKALAAAQARLDELDAQLKEKDETFRVLYDTCEALELEHMKENARKAIAAFRVSMEENSQALAEKRQELLEKQEELARLEAEIRAQIRFNDVTDPEKWYYDAVYWAAKNNITSGMGEGTFQPNARLTRAQTVTFLYKMAGNPDVSGLDDAGFTDVEDGKWYVNAVKWAVANGITTGYGKGTFKPDVACSRAMIVTFLMRYARLTGVYSAPAGHAEFKDVDEDDWFCGAVSWAVVNGITSGYGEGTFQPNVTCTRAMMVQFLKNFSDMANAA